MWPQGYLKIVQDLSYLQEYEVLWYGILECVLTSSSASCFVLDIDQRVFRAHFPPCAGFVVERFRKTDTSRHRNWVVRRKNDPQIVVVVTWEPPYPSSFGKGTSAARFVPAFDEFVDGMFLRLHAHGATIAYSGLGFDHPDNWAHNCFDPDGQRLIDACCLRALKRAVHQIQVAPKYFLKDAAHTCRSLKKHRDDILRTADAIVLVEPTHPSPQTSSRLLPVSISGPLNRSSDKTNGSIE